MPESLFGIPTQAFLGQLLLGLVNGSFYAMLSLGLAVIFGLLGIVNFAHGALYMIGAYVAWVGMEKFGINYWVSLLLAPLIVGALGVAIERTLLKHLYKIDPIYGLLLTFGLALIAEGVFRDQFGVSGQSYSVPDALAGVLAAPVIQITPLMGSNLIIIVFAVVVIGGMGSILGSILTGLALGLIEGLTKVFYPEASSIVVFVIMAIVLMIRPAGLFGKER